MKLNLNKKTKGDIAELFVSAIFIEHGWSVLFPFSENARYDIGIEKNGKFLRVQIKYATPKNNIINIRCNSSNNWSVKSYSKEEIDLLACYNPENKEVYFVDSKEIERNNQTISLRLEKAKNNQEKLIRYTKDYLKIPE